MVNSFMLISLVLVLLAFCDSATEAVSNGGFGIELVHRDSPSSPFYNHSETPFDRLRRSVVRSISRSNRLHLLSTDSDSSIVSQVIPNEGDYLMKLSIGTPPIEVLAIADTGSDLTWTQCKPCDRCYKQDLPLFDPKASSTYKEVSCDSKPCQYLKNQANCKNNACEYLYIYGDQSHTSGLLATETFIFDHSTDVSQNVSIPNLVFGCGHGNTGMFNSHGSGLVGLGGGPLSLVSQLGSKIDGKFSYCLVNMFENSTSKLNFGSQAVISSAHAVSTPLATKEPNTFYYLTLEGASIGDKKLDNKPTGGQTSTPAEGNIVIDSGTTLTMLESEFHKKLVAALKEAIPLDPVPDPSGTFQLCYGAKSEIKVPDVTFHFAQADLCLAEMNLFAEVSEDLVCFSMVASEGIQIYGNLAQMNFLVEYDLVGRKVNFAPADCSKN